MGQCYENDQLAMDTAAIRCYRRALVNQDREGIAVHKLVRPVLTLTQIMHMNLVCCVMVVDSVAFGFARAPGRPATQANDVAQQAQLHARRGENNEAAHYYRQSLQRSEEQGVAGPLDVEAVEFIAQVCQGRPV